MKLPKKRRRVVAVQQPRRQPVRHHHHGDGHHGGDGGGFPRRMGAMKQHSSNNNNGANKMMGMCASNGLNIHNIHLQTSHSTAHHHPPSSILPGSLANPSVEHSNGHSTTTTNVQQQNNSSRKNSKPSIFGVLRQTSNQSQSNGDTSDITTNNKGTTSESGPNYVQNTPNVHLYEMHA